MSTPGNVARAASLFLSFVFGVVGLGLNANAFVKSNNQKDAVLRVAPRGTSIDINDNDVFDSGAAVTAFCGVLALASAVSLGLLFPSLLRAEKSRERSLATRTLHWQGVVLSLSTVGLFAALVAMTNFVANGEAKVSASVNGVAVPTTVVQSLQRALGVTTVYHEISYRKWRDVRDSAQGSISPSRCSQARRYSTVVRIPFRRDLECPLVRQRTRCIGRRAVGFYEYGRDRRGEAWERPC